MTILKRNTGAVRARPSPKELLEAGKLLPHIGLKGARYLVQRNALLDLLKTRLIIPVQYGSHDQAQIEEIEEAITTLVTDKDWGGLGRLLQRLDQGRNSTPSGIRHLEIATYYLRGHLSAFYEPPSPQNFEYAFGFDAVTMAEIKDACEAFPDNYALSALFARMHIDCGWAARGDEDPALMAGHYDTARRLLMRFDPVAYNSPFLAEIQYRLCTGLKNGHERLGTAFQDWCDLDSSNMAMYHLHAFYCLPEWFGSAEILQSEARAAYRHTRDQLGAAAYSAMMLHALKFDKSVAAYLDVTLCLRGISDLLTLCGSDPFRVTATLRDIADAFQVEYGQATDPAFSRASDAFRAGLGTALRPHLSTYCAPAWPDAQDDFLEWASCAYLAELGAGQTVTLTDSGVEFSEAAA